MTRGATACHPVGTGLVPVRVPVRVPVLAPMLTAGLLSKCLGATGKTH